MPDIFVVPKADVAIEEIGIYIAEQSQSLEIARSFLKLLDATIKQYALFPQMGKVRSGPRRKRESLHCAKLHRVVSTPAQWNRGLVRLSHCSRYSSALSTSINCRHNNLLESDSISLL